MARPRSDITVTEVMPGSGLEIYQQPGRSSFYVRRYDPNTQRYIRRSTGQKTEEQAKAWVLTNLQLLFQAEAEQRGGGNFSITRQLSAHMNHLEQRYKAGEISEASLSNYNKCGRHFISWFATHKIKKLSDLDSKVLKNYGLNRINEDGYAPSTVNLEIVYLRMWISWLQDEEILTRPIKVKGVQQAVENRTQGEPFKPGDLKLIYQTVEEWKTEKSNKNFGGKEITKYNKELFCLFLHLLDESGMRQHEIFKRTWNEISVGQTKTNRQRIINTISVPSKAKRGVRQCVFRGESLIKIKELQKKHCPKVSDNDYIFRHHQTNTLIDPATFSRYWSLIQGKTDTDYVLHTFRSHRITQLILSGVEPQLVGRNLGLSLKQIERTYLRYTPAAHYNKLVQEDLPQDTELKVLIASK